jgi:hypothetical protein
MRLFLPLFALLVTIWLVAVDRFRFRPDSPACVHGLCTLDHIIASIDDQGLNSESALVALAQMPANPLLWCTYGELLALENRKEAAASYDRAVELGPHMAPVLMRTANFDFTHSRLQHGLVMTRQILFETSAFDQILFSYLTTLKVPTPSVLGRAVPAQERPARSWLQWLASAGSEPEVRDAWKWSLEHGFVDETSAVGLTKTLWEHGWYAAAQQIWLEWLGNHGGDYLRVERVWNRKFELTPTGSPFDWTIGTLPDSVSVERNNGLIIRFLGTENLEFSQVRQFVTVKPGPYRFSVELEAEGLTTDQHPLFHISAISPSASIATVPIENRSRTTLHHEFIVPPGATALQIQIERHPSDHFNNKISGTVHVYAVSLKPL